MTFTFLMCSERSGSNLITRLLNAHPDICGPATKHLINPVARNLFRYKDLSSPENWATLLQDIHSLFTANFSIWKKEFSIADLHQLAPCGDVNTLIKNIFFQEATEHKKTNLFIKENHLYEFLSFLLINFPDAKYIYQTRDPRDMALSWQKNKSHQGGIIAAAKQWSYDQKRFLRDYHALKSINKSFLIKYEDLIASPEETLQAALSFLGFKYHKEILGFYNDEDTIEYSKAQEAWRNLSKPILSDNSNKFISQLTCTEISIIEKICFYEMKALGYSPVSTPDDLQGISENEIKKLEIIENQTYPPSRSKGTIENIKAKSSFYLR